MYCEIDEQKYLELKKELEKRNIQFEASDCTLPGEKEKMFHIEMINLSMEQTTMIANFVTALFEKESEKHKEVVRTEEENEKPKEVRKREWDKKPHTLKEEVVGYMTGENMKETVTYER